MRTPASVSLNACPCRDHGLRCARGLHPGSVRKDEFKEGQRWALRRTRGLGDPATQVELLPWPQVKPPKVKVRHLDGELKGLEEFVRPTALLCPWK